MSAEPMMTNESPNRSASEPRVLPDDAWNRHLVDAVHPPDWVNPEPASRYHLVVVGAGTAGLVSAAIAAGLGARVALVERNLMGGDCLNVGCVPSKGIIRAAKAWAAARGASEHFGGPAVSGEGDFGAAMERMRRLRAGIAKHDGAQRFSELGVDVFLGEGRFTGRDQVEVGGRTLRFRRAVIATGARAAAPPIPGLEEAGYLTNETFFELTELPRRLIVLGGGPIGVEMAQSFARFGSDVHLVDMSPQILPREDRDAAEIVERALKRDGVTFHFSASTKEVERVGDEIVLRYESEGTPHEVRGDELLVAVGRKPNTEGLGLEEAGVRFGDKGVEVDDRLRTSNPRVYAIGDIASRYKFTHAADAQARMVVANALFFGRQKASRFTMPWATYTSPEIAHTGHYRGDAEKAGYEVDTITVPFSDIDRARLDGADEGFVRIHLEQGSDRILGATIVGDHAGDMISEITSAIDNGLGLSRVGKAIRPYPTQAEAIKRAADQYRKRALTPLARRFFSFFFRVFS